EASTRDPLRGEPVGLGLAVPGADATAWYLPFAHVQPFELGLLGDGVGGVRNLPALKDHASTAELRRVLEDPGVGKIGHDLKHTALVLSRADLTLRGLAFDTMVASYVLDPSRRGHDLASMSVEAFSHKPETYAELVGTGQSAVPFAE